VQYTHSDRPLRESGHRVASAIGFTPATTPLEAVLSIETAAMDGRIRTPRSRFAGSWNDLPGRSDPGWIAKEKAARFPARPRSDESRS
jgi:hypothetical protein